MACRIYIYIHFPSCVFLLFAFQHLVHFNWHLPRRGSVADGYWILMRNYVVSSLDIQYMHKWCVGVPDIMMCDIVLVQNLVPACFAFASVRLVALRWLVGWFVV